MRLVRFEIYDIYDGKVAWVNPDRVDEVVPEDGYCLIRFGNGHVSVKGDIDAVVRRLQGDER